MTINATLSWLCNDAARGIVMASEAKPSSITIDWVAAAAPHSHDDGFTCLLLPDGWLLPTGQLPLRFKLMGR
jgi:hypothetical protein